MISKELLNQVLGVNCTFCASHEYGGLLNFKTDDKEFNHIINIYELSHKCKEWAKKIGYRLLSGYDEFIYNETYTVIINHIYAEGGCRCDKNFEADTEPEAIFQACEWVLKEKEIK